MTISKWEGAALAVAAVCVAFTAGWFARGNHGAEPIRVETERTLAETVTVLPAPTETPAAETVPMGKLDLNTATVEELQALPGIGEKRAADIVADREENGPFRYPEDLTRVKGIGEETLSELLDYITTAQAEQELAGEEDP